jgi:hypothetical protein
MEKFYIIEEDLPEVIEYLLELYGNGETHNLEAAILSNKTERSLVITVTDKRGAEPRQYTHCYTILGEPSNRHRVREVMEKGLKSMMKEVQS